MLHALSPENWIKVFIGFMLVGADLVALFFLGQVSTLLCTRGQDSQVGCVVTTTWMNLSPVREVKFSPLLAAEIEESCDEEGCAYRVSLRSRTSSMALNEIYESDLTGKKAQADQINDFLADRTQASLRLEDGMGAWILLPLFFILVGVGMVASALMSNYKGDE
jgi:hypothetical protein